MANLVLTPNSVFTAEKSTSHLAGETIVAGQLITLLNGVVYIADKNTDDKNRVAGIALNSCSVNQPISFINSGEFESDATIVAGQVYVLSDVGNITAIQDLITGDYVSVIGYGLNVSTIKLKSIITGIQLV